MAIGRASLAALLFGLLVVASVLLQKLSSLRAPTDSAASVLHHSLELAEEQLATLKIRLETSSATSSRLVRENVRLHGETGRLENLLAKLPSRRSASAVEAAATTTAAAVTTPTPAKPAEPAKPLPSGYLGAVTRKAQRAADNELLQYRWRVVHEVRHVFQRGIEANWEDAGAAVFYEKWQASLRNGSLPHRAVYIPLPWRLVMEKEVNEGKLAGFVWLLDWWSTLELSKYRHFVTLQQCSTFQMKRLARVLNRSFYFPDDVRGRSNLRSPRSRAN